ncbi:hypothetical protein QTP86_025639, partial [Hemibagrus guttatus]
WVAWWLARLPHTSRVGGSIHASAVCVQFACSPRASGVSSGYTGFLPRSKDMHCRVIGISKLSVVCVIAEHKDWTLEQWKKVMWSDESRFTLIQSDGHI